MSVEIASSVVVALIATMATVAISILQAREFSASAKASSLLVAVVALLVSCVTSVFFLRMPNFDDLQAIQPNQANYEDSYQANYVDSYVSVYAGDGEHRVKDGSLAEASFVSPESILYDDETLYIVDSGYIRILKNETVSTLQLQPQYYKAKIVRLWKSDIFVLTEGWYNEHGDYLYSFLRIKDGVIENIYDANTRIVDFGISSDGTLWFINETFSTLFLGRIVYNAEEQYNSPPEWFADLAYDVESNLHMAFDALDNLYISDPDDGVILRIAQGERAFTIFAGKEGEKEYKDGVKPTFYYPTSIVINGEYLYVLDYNVVRRISLRDINVPLTDTLAGIPSKEKNYKVHLGKGANTTFSVEANASIASDNLGTLFLTDPENGVIYQINQNNR